MALADAKRQARWSSYGAFYNVHFLAGKNFRWIVQCTTENSKLLPLLKVQYQCRQLSNFWVIEVWLFRFKWGKYMYVACFLSISGNSVNNSWQHWHAVSRIASCSSSSMLRQWGAPNGGAGQHLRSCSAAAVAGRPARSTYQTSPHITPFP